MLFKEDFDCKIICTEANDDGRKILVNLEYQNESFSVLSIYAPNMELLHIEFLKEFVYLGTVSQSLLKIKVTLNSRISLIFSLLYKISVSQSLFP